MIKYGNLEQYELTLKAIGPVFVGAGVSISKVEYCYFPAKRLVAVLNDDKFFDYLVARGLTDAYEDFMRNAANPNRADLLKDFLQPNRVAEADVRGFTDYTIQAQFALDDFHSRKEIYLFNHNAAHEPYIPGSSLKGALRTAILTRLLLDKPWRGNFVADRFAADKLEAEYLNTLNVSFKQQDARNSLMRGLSLSDSLPVARENMALYQKEDIHAGAKGSIRPLNLIRECAMPRTTFRFSLTIDRRICPDWDAGFILDCLKRTGDFYRETYLPAFPAYRGKIPEAGAPVLFIGGGCGYAAKNVVYPAHGAAGYDAALGEVAQILQNKSKYSKQIHQNDVALGAAPHMLKIARDNEGMALIGLCAVALD